jgi:hypothetical protein
MYCLHPTKEAPTCWRLEYKSLKIQQYYPFERYGSKQAALVALKLDDEKIQKRLKAQKLRAELPYNLIFDDLGNVKGFSLSYGSRGFVLKMQLTIDGKQRGNSRRLSCNDLYDAFFALAQWRMNKLSVAHTLEIKKQLQVSYRAFELKYNQAVQDKMT